jgi:hypothetical protein
MRTGVEIRQKIAEILEFPEADIASTLSIETALRRTELEMLDETQVMSLGALYWVLGHDDEDIYESMKASGKVSEEHLLMF